MKKSAAFAFSTALLIASSSASALTIDLAPPNGSFGPTYSQDGFTFTNSANSPGPYLNWVQVGNPSLNASNANGDVVQNYGGTTNTLTNDANQPFALDSIGLAEVYNNGAGGAVQFTFNHVGGGSDSTTVTLLNGIFGLQTFAFNETNLTSVVFTPTQGDRIQFDDVVVQNINVEAVPEPSTWAMMILGFLGLGYMTYRRQASRVAVTA
jgi:hypothetical protein